MSVHDCIDPCAIVVKMLVDSGEIERATGRNKTVIEPIIQTLHEYGWIENELIDVERANRQYAIWRKANASP